MKEKVKNFVHLRIKFQKEKTSEYYKFMIMKLGIIL